MHRICMLERDNAGDIATRRHVGADRSYLRPSEDMIATEDRSEELTAGGSSWAALPPAVMTRLIPRSQVLALAWPFPASHRRCNVEGG